MPTGPRWSWVLPQHTHMEHAQSSKHAGLEGLATFLNFLDFTRCRSPALWAPKSRVRSSRGGAGPGQPSSTQGSSGVSSCT